MIPIDKSGNSIYPSKYNILLQIGRKLNEIGYFENNPLKPNLFSKKGADVIYFMDMRGTKEVPIWESPCPAFYIYSISNNGIPLWKWNRLMNEEMIIFRKNSVPFRQHVYNILKEYLSNENFGINESIPITEDEIDGYCKCCGSDMKDNKLACSEKCKELFVSKRLKQMEWEKREWELQEQKELERRKVEKEKGNPVINFNGFVIDSSKKEEYRKRYFRLNMSKKQVIRYLRERLIKEHLIETKLFCETPKCYEYAQYTHEKSYEFEDLFKRENYTFLCMKCHSKLHSELRKSKNSDDE